MHRTVGNAYIEKDIGGTVIRLFQDETGEEGVLGTEYYSGMANTVQEEISRVIEYAGLTLYDDDIEDESNEWGQLRDAIFESVAIGTNAITDDSITDAKVSDVSLSKLTNGKCAITRTHLTNIYTLEIDSSIVTPYILIQKQTGGTFPDAWTEMNYYEINLYNKLSADLYIHHTLNYEGLIGTDQRYADYTNMYTLKTDEIALRYDDVDPSGFIKATSITHGSGFSQIVYENAVQTGYCKLSVDGLYFRNSNYNIKHTVISFGITGWAGGGPYTKSIATAIPVAAHILGTFFTSKSFSAPTYTVMGWSEGQVNSITLTAGSTYLAAVSLDYDPTLYTEHFLTILYSDD